MDRGRLGTNELDERDDWGVTCGIGTTGVGLSKIERLAREEADAVGTGWGLSGEEGCERPPDWPDTTDWRESSLWPSGPSSW